MKFPFHLSRNSVSFVIQHFTTTVWLKQFQYRALKILSLFVLLSACHQKKQTNVAENDSNKNGIYKLYYSDTNILGFKGSYTNGVLDGESIYYYKNGNVRKKSNYEMGFKTGLEKVYYENGNLQSEIEYLKYYYSDTPFVNTAKNYDENGKLLLEESNYYDLLNQRKIYFLNEQCSLEVKLIGSLMEDKLHISIVNFDEEYNLGKVKERFYPNDSNEIVTVPISTNVLGENHLKFIINDYTFADLDDSTILVKQTLVDYEYLVLN